MSGPQPADSRVAEESLLVPMIYFKRMVRPLLCSMRGFLFFRQLTSFYQRLPFELANRRSYSLTPIKAKPGQPGDAKPRVPAASISTDTAGIAGIPKSPRSRVPPDMRACPAERTPSPYGDGVFSFSAAEAAREEHAKKPDPVTFRNIRLRDCPR